MKKRLFQLLVVAAIIGGGGFAYRIWRATPVSAEEYIAKGRQLQEENKYGEAIPLFLLATQADPVNREARFRLAQSYVGLGDRNTAANQLISLLEYLPDDIEANIMLGNLYLAGGSQDSRNLREASDIARKILTRHPDNVLAMLLSGNVAAGRGDIPTAVQMFNKALEIEPENVSALVSLGSMHILRKALPEAERLLLKARELDPRNKPAILSLANFYRSTKDYTKAAAVLNDGLTLFPEDLSIYGALVQMYEQTGEIEKGVALLRERIAQNPRNPAPYFVLSNLYKAANRPADARRALEEAKKALPDDADVAMELAANLMPDDQTRARAEVQQVLKTNPENPMALLLLGQLQLISDDLDGAAATLGKDILTRSRIPEAAFFLGNLALRQGQLDKAAENYQRAVNLNPQYLVARVALAEVLFARGNVAGARVEVDNALAIQPSFIPARLLKADVDRAENNLAGADSELAALARDAPDNLQVIQQVAANHASRGRFAEAEKGYLRLMELQPGSADALRGLVDVYVRGRQTEKSVRTITAIPEERRGAFHYELLGVTYSAAGRNAEAESAFKKAIEKEPKRAGSEALLARHYISSGRVDEGLAQLDEFAKKVPIAAVAHGAKGLIYESRGQLSEAKISYEKALEANPDYEPAANNLAYILAEEGNNLSRALNLAQTARRLQPQSPAIADTLGWVQFKLGNHLAARDQLTFAVSKDPENPVFNYHLGMIYRATLQNRDAEAALKKALASKRDFKERSLAEAEYKILEQGR